MIRGNVKANGTTARARVTKVMERARQARDHPRVDALFVRGRIGRRSVHIIHGRKDSRGETEETMGESSLN